MTTTTLVPLLGLLVTGVVYAAQGFEARHRGHYQFGWMDGWVRGKWLPWRVRLAGGLITIGACITVAALSWTAYPPAVREFDIAAPAGWYELPDDPSQVAATDVELAALRAEARNVDVVGVRVDEGRMSYFEADVGIGRWDASIVNLAEAAEVQKAALQIPPGAALELGGYALPEVKGVVSGRYSITVRSAEGTQVILVYILPGRASRALLAYLADTRDFDKHLPGFLQVVEHARRDSVFIFPFNPLYLAVVGIVLAAILMRVYTIKEPPLPAATAIT